MKPTKHLKSSKKPSKIQIPSEKSEKTPSKCNKLFREIASPRSPPYLNSRSRLKELALESDIKSCVNMKRHPELTHLNYKGWRNRTNDQKISYLDTIFAKQLAKHYEESLDSVGNSKVSLQNLTKTLEQVLYPESQNDEKVNSPKEKASGKILHPRLRAVDEVSLRIFNRTVFHNSEVNEASLKLDKIRKSIGKIK
jgi:hypothetical protein